MEKRVNFGLLVFCILIVFLVGFLGSLLSFGNSDSSWYDSIKPSITPPGFVFPIVWNVLFLLIGLSLYFALTNINDRKKVWIVFGSNLLLNALWSLFFFGLKLPLLAFFDLIFILVSILAMIFVVWKDSKISGYFLMPYFLWVCFAGVLNFLVILKN